MAFFFRASLGAELGGAAEVDLVGELDDAVDADFVEEPGDEADADLVEEPGDEADADLVEESGDSIDAGLVEDPGDEADVGVDQDLGEDLGVDEDESSACAPYLERQMSCIGSRTPRVKDTPFLGSAWGAKEAGRCLHPGEPRRDLRYMYYKATKRHMDFTQVQAGC